MREKKKISITIGIPAYNEEANIGGLLTDLLSQNPNRYKLDSVIVYSDGSEDKTDQVVKGLKSKKIVLIDEKKRKGVASGINSIFKKANSDIVVLLNADIRITDKNFVTKIVEPIEENKADLTSCAIREVEPVTKMEKILYVGMRFKTYIFETYKKGNNLYTCHGPARAFSKRLYKTTFFKQSMADDMYSYIFCVSQGYKYTYVKDAFVYYKLPGNLRDHERQSMRFIRAKKRMTPFFAESLVSDEYKLPLILYAKYLLMAFMKYPIYMPIYAALYFYIYFKNLLLQSKSYDDKWQVSKSSKVIDIN